MQVLQLLMLDFQFMEEGLRGYVSTAYELIRTKMHGILPFKLSRRNLTKDALGKLLDKYEQLSDRADLVKEIRSLQAVRNHCAHQGLLLTSEEQNDGTFLASEIGKLTALRERTRTCVCNLLEECRTIAADESAPRAEST